MTKKNVPSPLRKVTFVLGTLATGSLLAGCSQAKEAEAPVALSCEGLGHAGGASIFAETKGQPVHIVKGTRQLGKLVTKPVEGASSFVVAEPGVTRAYLERIAMCEASSLSIATGVEHTASVDNRPGGYRVAITTKNEKAAKSLVDYAQREQTKQSPKNEKSVQEPGIEL